MIGPEGVPDLLIDRRLMEFFNMNWFEIADIPLQKRMEALIIFEVEDEISEKDTKGDDK